MKDDLIIVLLIVLIAHVNIAIWYLRLVKDAQYRHTDLLVAMSEMIRRIHSRIS